MVRAMLRPMGKVTVLTPSVLCRAVRDRRLLEFHYRGHHRVVAAYCHGRTRGRVEVLRAVQLRGSSRSGAFGIGKLWKAAEMHNVHVIDEGFIADDPDYHPDDSAMVWIHCRI
jgi:hypothetical protein